MSVLSVCFVPQVSKYHFFDDPVPNTNFDDPVQVLAVFGYPDFKLLMSNFPATKMCTSLMSVLSVCFVPQVSKYQFFDDPVPSTNFDDPVQVLAVF